MNILLIGSGAREHAIARAIHTSPQQTRLFCFGSSNNPGIQAISHEYVTGSLTEIDPIVTYAKVHAITFAIIGPEAPLEAGVVDALQDAGIPCIGPTKSLARLETSKSFTRDLMTNYNIDAFPKYKYFASIEGVATFLNELGDDFVIKCDGLMGGKGVLVSGEHLQNRHEAYDWCVQLVKQKKTFLIEEKLVGEEFSYISLSDGEHLAHTFAIQDHKRAFEGDTGPNTGGMGTYSDANHSLPFLTEQDIKDAQQINHAVMRSLRRECGEPYKGVLYGGFMVTKDGVKVIEYNARFGDPEAMNIFALLETDFVAACQAVIDGTLTQEHLRFAHKASVCKYAVPEGYPTNPVRNKKIDVSALQDKEKMYYAAVDHREGGLYETGSRAAAIVGIGETIAEAETISEAEVSKIKGPLFHRKDIGKEFVVQRRITHMEEIRGSVLSPFRREAERGLNRSRRLRPPPALLLQGGGTPKPVKSVAKIHLAVLGSTKGTSLQPIIDAIEQSELDASIDIVISNKPDAYILERARKHNITAVCIEKDGRSREDYDKELLNQLTNLPITHILLIGWMRILSPVFVRAYKGKILNVHPSLLPKFAGGMDMNVHQAVLDAGETETGCTIHLVDEGVDTGKILIQKKCSIEHNETAESLKKKVQKLEGEAFVELLTQMKGREQNAS